MIPRRAVRSLSSKDLNEWAGLAVIAALPFVLYRTVSLGQEAFFLRDVGAHYVALQDFTAHSLRAGELPLWHDGVGIGYPHHADIHSALFYPLAWPVLLFLPMPWAYGVLSLLQIALGGAGVWLLLKHLDAGPIGALAGAVAYATSGYATTILCVASQLPAMAWAGWVLLAWSRLRQAPSGGRLALVSLSVAMAGVAGDPMGIVQLVLLMSVWTMLVPRQAEERGGGAGRDVSLLVGVVVLAALLLSIVYGPMATLVAQSVRSSGVERREMNFYHLRPGNLYNLLIPLPYPDLSSPKALTNFQDGFVPMFYNNYLGPVVLLFAGFALVAGGRLERGLGGLGVLSILLAMGPSGGVNTLLVTLLPPLSMFRTPSKYLLILNVVIALLAGLGVGAAFREERPPRKLVWLTVGLSVLSGLLVLSSWAMLIPALTRLFGEKLQLIRNPEVFLATVSASYRASLLEVLVSTLALLSILLLARRGTLSRTASALATVVLLGGNLIAANLGTQPVMDPAFYTQPPRIVGLLPEPTRDFRFFAETLPMGVEGQAGLLGIMLAAREEMSDQYGTLHGYNTAGGAMALRLAAEKELTDKALSFSGPDRFRALGALNIRYVLSLYPRRDAGEAATIRTTGPVTMYDLAGYTPRVFLPDEIVWVGDDYEVAAHHLLEMPHRVRVGLPAGSRPLTSVPGRGDRVCRVVERTPSRVAIEVEPGPAGVLVLMEGIYPGWSVAVDGEEAELLSAMKYFRAVAVGESAARVEFLYRPWDLTLGAALSLLGLVVCLALTTTGTGSHQLVPVPSYFRGR